MRLLLIACVLLPTIGGTVLAKPSPEKVAQKLDATLANELFDEGTYLAPQTSDEEFVRRIWLDVVGDIPTPEETIAFVLDPSPDKRQRLIEQLLESPAYGQNWARYWRDVVFHHAIDDRSRIAIGAMEAELSQQFNENKPWNEIATKFITSQGDVQQNGSAAIMMAQDARTEETAAEVSRVFLGIQIQCAQCHDHPYDRWQREQFHEFAAFFPRIGLRSVREVTRRSFEIFANDNPGRRRKNDNGNRPQAEHFMPDLEDPTAEGEQMQPKFFLTGGEVPYGTKDADRREQLSAWLTNNEWFAIAMVNRMWMELVGEGFYEPVDDIGPDRKSSAPETVRLLADKFRQSGYDVKWLMRSICQTEAYQRQSQERRAPDEPPFTANVPQRLRSDQLFNSIYTAIGKSENDERFRKQPANRRFAVRNQFDTVFGYDPSIAREEIGTSIPQILALMNDPRIDREIVARRGTALQHLLSEINNDRQLVAELYLRWLCRQPTEEELATALDYRRQTEDRKVAFEDIQWALINSSEFQHRP